VNGIEVMDLAYPKPTWKTKIKGRQHILRFIIYFVNDKKKTKKEVLPNVKN
jgi:hypothetical protein